MGRDEPSIGERSRSGDVMGRGRWRPRSRWLTAVAGIAAAVAIVALWLLPEILPARDVLSRVVPPDRLELSFGRSADFDYDPPEPGAYSLPVLGQASDGRVLGPDGHSRSLLDVLRGRVTLLSFIYTRCADPRACPMSSGVLYQVHRVSEQDPVIAKNVHLVTFSFDPEHDTPQVMADYGAGLRSESGGCPWTFLTTSSSEELTPILESYGQVIRRKKDPDDPLGPFSHIVRVHLVDREGMIRNIYSFSQLDPRLVMADIRTLLLEQASTVGVM